MANTTTYVRVARRAFPAAVGGGSLRIFSGVSGGSAVMLRSRNIRSHGAPVGHDIMTRATLVSPIIISPTVVAIERCTNNFSGEHRRYFSKKGKNLSKTYGDIDRRKVSDDGDVEVYMREFQDGVEDIGEKKDKNAINGIDRSKFTHEVKVVMPELGDGEEDFGVIEKWYKKEGDLISRNEVICDIRTELFTFGMLTDDDYDSIMGEILIPEESEPMKPGTYICTTFNEGHCSEKTEEKKEDE